MVLSVGKQLAVINSGGRIAGRSRRNRRGERVKCALVLPNFGVK
ncbi:hypothetical protein [Neisseria sp. KEM232]|nr:hypothetical protein [Neisseria sp. KEM232]